MPSRFDDPSAARKDVPAMLSRTLSPREREIALGVRVGSSNVEIASRLGLSVKTVEYHLSRIYARLGFRSRAQLAALVEREMHEA